MNNEWKTDDNMDVEYFNNALCWMAIIASPFMISLVITLIYDFSK